MKKFFLIVLFIFLSHFHIARALEITEVMYDLEGTDSDREWIEIYNNEGTSVDISTYKLFEASTNHGLTVVQGDKNLPAGSYAIIVQDKGKFKTDWPAYTGSIFDSAFSLSNDGENIAIKDANLNVVSELNYLSSMGANGDGKSLQKISSTWQSAVPTPGSLNVNNANSTPVENNSASNQNTGPSQNSQNTNIGSGSSSVVSKELKTTTEIITSNFGFAKNPLEIKAQTINAEGEKLFYGKYFFNFGDGASEEYSLSSFQKITHTYKYAGEYLLHLSYYLNSYDSAPIATDKILIKIFDAGVFISSIGDEKDFFIEIKNNTNYENDISGWYISALDKKFIFPKNSFLPAGNKIVLSPENTNFIFEDANNLRLYDSFGNLIFDYGGLYKIKKKTPLNITKITKSSNKNSELTPNKFSITENTNSASELINLNEIDNENLGASSLNAVAESKIEDSFWIYFLGLGILIISAIFGVIFLRKKGKKVLEGDDFEISE